MERNKKGFTLIEILVVVLIIGVLTAIAIPAYRKTVEKGKAVEAVSVINDAAKAEQEYALNSSSYTNLWEDLVINQPNVVAGTVYCLQGSNTANQDDCGNDSSYKVKLTVGNNNNSVVMATRMPNNPYGDYKLFKFMNGDPNIYCKAAATSPTDICEVLGFPSRNLPETRNIDRVESFNCSEIHGFYPLDNPSSYNCEREIYDDGSFEEKVYSPGGILEQMVSLDSEENVKSHFWYYDSGAKEYELNYDSEDSYRQYFYFEDGDIYFDGQVDNGNWEWFVYNAKEDNPPYLSYEILEDGNYTKTIWAYKQGVGHTNGSDMAVQFYDANGNTSEGLGYFEDGSVRYYTKFNTATGGREYWAEYNNDGSISRFICYTSACGTPGNCTGAACASSGYNIPDADSYQSFSSYVTQEEIDKMCSYDSEHHMTICQ